MKSKYTKLPPKLALKLAELEKKLFRVQVFSLIFLSILIVLFSFYALLAFDRMALVGASFRWVLWSLTCLGLLGLSLHWLKLIIQLRRSKRIVLKALSKKLPFAADHVEGAIDLTEQHYFNESEALKQAAIRQIDQESEKFDFDQVVSYSFLKKSGLFVCGSTLLFLFGLWFDIDMMRNTFARWFSPWEDIERYTFVRLEKHNKKLVVPSGEAYQVNLKIDRDSKWLPDKVSVSNSRNKWRDHSIENGEVILDMPGISSKTTLYIKAGDSQTEVLVIPVYRSNLISREVEIEFPSYLQMENKKYALEETGIQVLRDSKLQFFLNMSSEVMTCYWNGSQNEVSINGSSVETRWLKPVDDQKWQVYWIDQYGFESARRHQFSWNIIKDKEPKVKFVNQSPAMAILDDATLELEIKAEDDYHLKYIDLQIEISPIDNNDEIIPQTKKIRIADRSSLSKLYQSKFIFSPLGLDIPSQSQVVIKAICNDDFPDREEVISRGIVVYVLNKTQHADLLKSQFDDLMNQIDSLNLKQENLFKKHSELSLLNEEEISSQKIKNQFSKLKRQIDQNHKKSIKIQKELQELIDESMLNDKVKSKDIEEWLKVSETLSQLNNEFLPQTMSGITPENQSNQEKIESTKKALEPHKKALEALKSIPQKAQEALKNMEIRNFISRLQKASEHESLLYERFKEIIPKTIALDIDELEDELKLELDTHFQTHELTVKDLKELQKAFIHFYSRVKEDIYKEIHDEMNDTQMVEKMTMISNYIKENRLNSSLDKLIIWRDQLSKWAKLLIEAQESEGDQNQNSEESQANIDLTLMIELLRLIEKEQDLRQEVNNLEELKELFVNYPMMSTKLAYKQSKLINILDWIKKQVQDVNAIKLLNYANDAMNDVRELLRKPQTDEEVIAGIDEIIELLTRGFHSKNKNSKMSPAMQALLMAMLNKSLGQGVGNMPGMGSTAGGSSNMKSNSHSGSSKEEFIEFSNEIITSKGFDEKVPEEYKKAYERYIKRIESEK